MDKFWELATKVDNWEEFVVWFDTLSTGGQIFVSLVGFGVGFAAIILVLFLIPFESK